MTGPDIWNLHGGTFRRMSPPSARSSNLELDPIDVAMMVLYARVLISMRKYKWLSIAIGVVRDFDTFIQHVQPDPDVKAASHQTIAKKWLRHLQQLAAWGVIEPVPASVRMAYGKFFIVPKPGQEGGRAIFDFSILARMSARPYPVNTVHIAAALRKIGSWSHRNGYVWAADYRHWWFQNPIADPRIRSFFTLEVDAGGHKTLVFQAKVCSMGASWSAYTGHCVTWGIALGEMPPNLASMIDWSVLEGDSPPSWISLIKDGVEIGIIIAFYDNFYVFSEEKDVVDRFRSHVMKRSTFCNAKFKAHFCERCNKSISKSSQTCISAGERHCTRCLMEIEILTGIDKSFETERCRLVPDPVSQSADFLGVIISWDGTRWVWRHRDQSMWHASIPLSGQRKLFAHFVGVILWDATVNLETTSRIDPAIDVIRRVSKGVVSRMQWKEIVTISEEEANTLSRFMRVAITRDLMFVTACPIHLRSVRPHIFIATDASQHLVAWMLLNSGDCVDSFKQGYNYDVALAVGPHIFYKELQAATWGFVEAAVRFYGASIFLATDNAAVYWVLLRMVSGVRLAAVQLDFISQFALSTDTTLSCILIPGVQNCSDSPTRRLPFDQERIDATLRHLFSSASGGARSSLNWGTKRPQSADQRAMIEEIPNNFVPPRAKNFVNDAPVEIMQEREAFEDLDDG